MKLVYDISRWQDPPAGMDGDAVIIQAGRGRDPGGPRGGILDPMCAAHCQAARDHGKPFNLYWRVFPDLGLDYQAQLLTHVAERERPTNNYTWLDIENPSTADAWPGDAGAYERQFIALMNQWSFQCGTYANDSFWKNRGITGPQGIWKASYSYVPAKPWDGHQRTSTPIDTNDFEDDAYVRFFGVSAPETRTLVFEDNLLME